MKGILKGIGFKVIRFVLVTLGIAAAVYGLFALVVSTDVEKMLKRENRAFEQHYPELDARTALLEDAVAGLQHKDNSIYMDVFGTHAPSADPVNSLAFLFGSDTIPETKIISYTAAKSDVLVSDADEIEKNFTRVFLALGANADSLPPMGMPLDDVAYPQIGASRGLRLNPFLKAKVQHNGLDIIAVRGTPVRATADGIVKSVDHSGKGHGNMVTVGHEGGYVTRYSHLSEIGVSAGQRVSRGTVIGTVGMSGSAYAPHLHYEIRKDSLWLDPVAHLAAAVGPEDFANMLYMAVNTEQSMD